MPIRKQWDYVIEVKKNCTKEEKSISVVKRGKRRGA